MANKAGQITFGVGFQVDKSGLNELQNLLNSVQVKAAMNGKAGGLTEELKKAGQAASQLQSILERSYNTELGSLNVAKFNSELERSGLNIKTLKSNLEGAGSVGNAAFNRLSASILSMRSGLKQSSVILDEMAQTLKNSFKYTLSYGLINGITSAISSAYHYSKSLDSSLNDIRIVTGKSADEMDRFAQSANKAAKELGQSTTDYTKASLIYYQQGLEEPDIAARTNVTLKAANVTGQSTQEVSEQLTAVWNGYKVSAQEAELYVDKLAAVAATTASDLEELSTGMSKVASAAAAMGVDVDQLNGMLSTIVSVTRQAPESAGTALKTIFARMGDLELDGEDEFGVSLGEVSSSLKSVGIQILDTTGSMRDMGEVIEEVGQKWNSGIWSDAEKQALAIDLAGKRQYNNLLALFNNWDMYNKAVETSSDSAGTLEKQQQTYLESTEAHLNKLQTTWEDVYADIFKSEDVNKGLDLISNTIDIFDDFIESTGGGLSTLVSLIPMVGSLFSKQINDAIVRANENLIVLKNNFNLNSLKDSIVDQYTKAGVTPITVEEKGSQANAIAQAEVYKTIVENAKGLTEEQINILQKYQEQYGALKENEAIQEHNVEQALAKVSAEQSITEAIKERAGYEGESFSDQLKNAKPAIEEIQNALEEMDTGGVFGKTQVQALEQVLLKNKDILNDNELLKKSYSSIENILPNIKTELFAWGKVSNKTQQEITHIVEELSKIDGTTADIQVVEEAIRQLGNIGTDAKTKLSSIKDIIEQMNSSAVKVNVFNAVSSGLTVFNSALMYTNSLMTTLSDESLSAADKIEKVLISSASMGVMIVSNWSNFQKALASLSETQAGALVISKLYNDEKAREILETQLLTEGTKLNTLAKVGNSSIAKVLTVLARTDIDLTNAEIVAKELETLALDKDTAAKIANKIATMALGNSLKYAKLGMGLLVAAIAIGINVWRKYKEHQEEVRKNTIKLADDNIKLSQSNIELYNSYLKVAEGVQKGTSSMEELRSEAKKLEDSFVSQEARIATLTGNYSRLTEAIKEAKKAELENQINEEQIKQDQYKTKVRENTAAGNGSAYRAIGGYTVIKGGRARTQGMQNLFEQLGYQNVSGFGYEQSFASEEELIENYRQAAELIADFKKKYNQDSEEYKELVASGLYKTFVQQSSKEDFQGMIESLDAEANDQLQLDLLKLQEGLENQTIPSNSLASKIDEISKAYAETAMVSQEKAKEIILNALGQIDNISIQDFLNQQGHEILQNQARSAIATTSLNLNEEERQRFQSNYAGYDIASMSDEDLDYLIRWAEECEVANVTLSDFIAKEKELKLTSGETGKVLEDMFSQLVSGELTEENLSKNLDKIGGQLVTLEQMFPELADEIDVLNNAALIGTQLYIDSLEKVKDAVEGIQIGQAFNNFDEVYEEAEVKIKAHLDEKDLDEVDTTLEDIMDKEYDITIQVQAAMDSAVKDIESEMDRVTSLADSMGDGFVVSADKIKEVAQAFPGILGEMGDAYTVTKEGMIDLDDKVAQAAIDAAHAETQAEAENLANQLRMNAEVYDNKAAAYEAIVKIATEAGDDESSVADAVTAIKSQLKAIEEQDAKLCAVDIQKASSETADVEGDNYEASAKNAAASYNSQIANASNWANQTMAYAAEVADALDAAMDFNPATKPKGSSSHIAVYRDAVLDKKSSTGPKTTESSFKSAYDALDDNASYQQQKALLNDSIEKATQLAALNKQLATDARASAAEIMGYAGEMSDAVSKAGTNRDKKKSGGSKDTIDLLEDELDLYHDINLQLEDVEHNLKMLQKEEDKAFGKNYIDNLNTQNKLLEKQKKLLRDKLQLTANDMATRRAELALEGAQFDSQGYLANYNSLLQDRLNKVNALITAYNGLGEATTDEAKEANKLAKEQVDQAKKEYDSLKSQIDAYDKLIGQYQDIQESIQDIADQQIENQIKAFNYEIDVRLDMADATRNWNEFYEKVIEDIEGIEDPVKKIITSMRTGLKDFESYFNGRDGLGSVQYLTEHVRETMAQVESIKNTGTSSIYGDNMKAAVDDLKKYNDELMDNLENVQDIINDIKKSYLDALDDAKDKLDEQTEQYEYIADLIQHDMNMVELLGGEDDYADLARYYEMMHNNNLQNVEFLRMQRDAIKSQLASVEEGSEAWKKLYAQVQDTQKELNSAVEESLNNIIDKYSNAIKNVFDKLNKSVTGGLGLDYMQEAYDRQVDNGDDYLDDPNRLYSIAKIRSKYQDALNSTSDLSAQRKIADVMAEQLKYLEEKDKLSQYEVDRAEKIYDLTMKQIALQEAQANKSQLRLKRDSQGNYSYQYVADKDAINDAQQEVNDAMNNLYNFDLDRYREILGQATDLTKEYEEQVSQILQDASLSEEERTRRLEEVKKWYYNEMNALEEQLAINKINLQESANMALEELYRQDNEVFQGVLFDEMVPGWDGALDHMVTNFTEEFIPKCEDSMNELNETTQEYEQEIHQLEQSANMDFDAIRQGIDWTIDETEALMRSNEAVISTYNEEMDAINQVVAAMDALIDRYREAMDAAKAMAEAAHKAWEEVQLLNYAKQQQSEMSGMGNISAPGNGSSGNNGTGGGSDNSGSNKNTVTYTQPWLVQVYQGSTLKSQFSASSPSEGKSRAKDMYPQCNVTVTRQDDARHILVLNARYVDSGTSSNDKRGVGAYTQRFASGGYTGDWHSSEGKLAVLDSKELVLNADDTKNMLSAVNVVRHIVASLDGSMNARVAGMQMSPAFGQVLSGVGGASAVDQNVTISASFPNVSSHTEIEQAFENLVNRASQAAWSTRV